MEAALRSGGRFRFGLFELDRRTGELLRAGRRVRLQEQPVKILTFLLERPGELVTREELRQRLWPADTFVDFDDGLNAAVKKLRFALGDSPENPRFIETIPRRGYRFIAPVMGGTVEETPAQVLVSSSDSVASVRRTLGNATWVGFAVVIVAVAVTGVALLKSNGLFASRPDLSAIRSVVVLPLKNLSNDPEQQYFADGMTEELIARLASLGGLRVISRTSAMQYRDTKKLLPEIASELHVDTIVEGSVLHSGNRVRITAQLVHGPTDRHLWAESYERHERDVLDLQNEVARDIAEKVRSKLTPAGTARPVRVRPIDPEAHRAYLRGRYRWHTRRLDELEKAIADFQRAVAVDPNYALAYAGLADVYLVRPLLTLGPAGEDLRRAKEAAERALQLDPALAEAHNSNAYVKMYQDWDFAAAERGFREAIELNPNFATAHQWYAELLALQRRHDEARKEIGIALNLDPLSAVMHHQAGQCYQQARRYDEALQEYKHAAAIDPAFDRITAGSVYRLYLRTGKAMAAMDLVKKHWGANAEVMSQFERAAARGGTRGYHLKQLELANGRWSRPYYGAVIHAAVGQDDQALDWLEKAYQHRDELIFYANVDPEWDHLRSDPRFVAILDKVGLNRAVK